MVLVSNFYGNMAVVLQEFGFDGLFREVIESAVVGVRKPDPRIFTLGVEALGLKPEEVVVVGDSMDKDIIPAKQAGCQTVWLKGEGWTNDPMDESIPDRTITDLSDLLET
jgi:putative hydrolase of the HAD superfamily